MKAFKVKYTNGQLIDLESNLPLFLVNNEEFTITGKDKSFRDIQTSGDAEKVINLDSDSKLNWVNEKYGEHRVKLLLPAETSLFFRIGHKGKTDNDESNQFIFKCKLLEDLYLFKIGDTKGLNPEDWRLADCNCLIESCILGGLKIIPNLEYKSLNSLFNYTVQNYFNGKRSGATNSFKTFYLYENEKPINFYGAKNNIYQSLDKLRINEIKKSNLNVDNILIV